MGADVVTAMLATLGGFLALLLGLLLLLLPLLATELSRARDSVWGAVVLLLGLVLVTSAERLTGAPMLAVLCGGLLIGRLGVEVGQARWRLLSDEERRRLWSWERWRTSLHQIGASLARLAAQTGGVASGLAAWLKERRAARPASTKRWVRPESAAGAAAAPAGPEPAATTNPSAVTSTGSEAEASAQPEPEPEPEPDPEPEPAPAPAPQPLIEPEPEPEPEPNQEPETAPSSVARNEPQGEAQEQALPDAQEEGRGEGLEVALVGDRAVAPTAAASLSAAMVEPLAETVDEGLEAGIEAGMDDAPQAVPPSDGDEPPVVASFEEIDALLAQAIAEPPAGGEAEKGLGEAG